LTFNARQRAAIKRWIGQAVPLQSVYFRSVEYRYIGAVTRAHGGRFAAVGIRAVYLSATDSGARKEITARNLVVLPSFNQLVDQRRRGSGADAPLLPASSQAQAGGQVRLSRAARYRNIMPIVRRRSRFTTHGIRCVGKI